MTQGNRQPPQGKVAERAAVVFGGQVSGKPIVCGRWRSDVPPVGSDPVAALERALAALGPEDAGAKAGLQAALERAKQKAKVAPSRAPAPEVTIDAARVRVARLEAALSALADRTGPEVDALTAALARARIAASPPPVDVQVTQCQQFIERAVKRIDDLDKAREVEAVRLQEARDRLQRLQQEAAARGVWSSCFQGTSTEAKDANRHSRTQSRQGPVFGFDGGGVRRASRFGGSSLGTWYTAHTGSVA